MGFVLFLGAGFSAPAGLPLGKSLFEGQIFSHSRKAFRDIEATKNAWNEWTTANPQGTAEEFISWAHDYPLQNRAVWPSLVRFLAYRLAGPFTRFYHHDGKTSRSSDNLFSAHVCETHRVWWDAIFPKIWAGTDLTVITTNWDICIERALRPRPTISPKRPGFNYGKGRNSLKATNYPTRWKKCDSLSGSIPLLKLHGSLNWAVEHGDLVVYGDCRPAFRGDAAIVPPAKFKSQPTWSLGLWQEAQDALLRAEVVAVVGYSFPAYDLNILNLFEKSFAASEKKIHIFDPDAHSVANRIENVIGSNHLVLHPGLPVGNALLQSVF